MKKLDGEMKKTDLLLYQMIPKKIADRLRSGEKAENLCEVRLIFFCPFPSLLSFLQAVSIGYY
jgi:guanylate cyclase